MDNPAVAIDALTEAFGAQVSSIAPLGLTDEQLMQATAAVARLRRRVDAFAAASAAEIDDRSRSELGASGLAARKGYGSARRLLECITLESSDSAWRLVKVGRETRGRVSISGERLPANFGLVAEALQRGAIGLDSAHVIVRGLGSVAPRVGKDALEAAEWELVAAATGTGPDSPLPVACEELRIQTEVWTVRLDQDGDEPLEERAMRMRGVSLGRERDGLVPIRGAILPDIAAKFTAVFDSCMSPRTAPVFLKDEELAARELEHDPRTRDQQRHDILAGVIDIAARSAELPTMGGAAPTVLVSVRERDLETGRGFGFIEGLDSPVSLAVVKQYTCSGGTQRVVFDEAGRIIELGSPQRCFTPQQRRAITLRDGGCIIPGCNIPAAWSEIHHVQPDAQGGPTHTDNGVLLCWFHHRTIESSGWSIRMVGGVPEIRAPQWNDPSRSWRPASKSRVARLDTLDTLDAMGPPGPPGPPDALPI